MLLQALYMILNDRPDNGIDLCEDSATTFSVAYFSSPRNPQPFTNSLTEARVASAPNPQARRVK